VDVEPDSKSGSLGVSHTPFAWLLAIMDFPQPYCSSMDQKIEPYSNAWASQVLKMKVNEKAPHAEIESSSNPMDSLQGFCYLKCGMCLLGHLLKLQRWLLIWLYYLLISIYII
jgi:hypothetical protein